MRMHNPRFTRLTNAFSKKFENHAHLVAIYAVWYNWLRIHKTPRVTPAMAAGLSKTVMDCSDIIALMDAKRPSPDRVDLIKKRPNRGDLISPTILNRAWAASRLGALARRRQ
jgi:hypothetical protein